VSNLGIFADFGTTLTAFVIFSFFMIAPGYVAGWLTDACGFREGSALRQAALTVPLSISVVPILVYLPWRFFSIRAVWVVLAAIAVAFWIILAMELRDASRRPDGFKWQRRAAWSVGFTAVAVWMLIGLGSLLDLRMDNRLYFSYSAFDYLSRVPIANSIAHQDKLPAVTPFLTLREPVQLRYHYFWPMVCGLVTLTGESGGELRLDGAGRGAFTARDATTAGALWSGIALICLIAVYQRIFQGLDPARWRPYAIGVALLGVTGLDILPVLQFDYQHYQTPSMILPTTEWWNEQVTGWLDAMLWVPHHMTALVACLIAFLLLWHDSEQPGKWPRAATIVLAGMALASAVGMSVFVAFVFACILVVWALLVLIRRQPKAFVGVAAAGVLSLVMALPFLLELRSSAPVSGGIAFQVRRFGLLPEYLGPLGLTSREQTWTTTFYRLTFLPLNYFLELGVYFYAAVLFLKRLWRSRPISGRDLAAVAMLGTSVTICTFLGSEVAASGNDLGWRGFMAAQFILLLWTADLLDDRVPETRLHKGQYGALLLLLLIGSASTVFDLATLRGYYPFIDSQLFNKMGEMPLIDRRFGERFAARADTFAWIRSHTPANTVVEANPDAVAYFYGLYAERPALAIGGECDGYSGRTLDCYTLKQAMRPLFSGDAALQDFSEACRSLPLDLLVITDADQVWRTKDSWIHHYRPVYSSEFSAVFACRPQNFP
jgi:hypothetical protein